MRPASMMQNPATTMPAQTTDLTVPPGTRLA